MFVQTAIYLRIKREKHKTHKFIFDFVLASLATTASTSLEMKPNKTIISVQRPAIVSGLGAKHLPTIQLSIYSIKI